MKLLPAFVFIVGLLGAGVGAFASDLSCNDLISGLSPELQSSIRDLAKFRFDLDQRLANGQNDAVTRSLQMQYLQKEKEVLAAAKVDYQVLLEKIRLEVERVQRDMPDQAPQRAQQKHEVAESINWVKQIGTMKIQRRAPIASVLRDGRVLVTGGIGPNNQFVREIEVIDPKTGNSEVIGTLKEDREGYSQTVLLDGRVLIAGGSSKAMRREIALVNSVEMIDPDTGETSLIAKLARGRSQHAQSLLPDGRILLTSGFLTWDPTPSVEVIDPSTNAVEIIGSLKDARWAHAQSTLPDGCVLISGGYMGSKGVRSASIEVFDPKTKESKTLGQLTEGRALHQQSVLEDGSVVIVGGLAEGSISPLIEIVDSKTGEVKSLGNLIGFGVVYQHAITPDGKRLVVVHGSPIKDRPSEVELFDLTTGESEIVAHLSAPKIQFAMSFLPNGDLLIVGGGSDAIELVHLQRR